MSKATDEELTASRTEEERDEIAEVHKFSRKDTNRIRLWRLIIAMVLLVTALTVTLTTYKILKSEQDESFDTAVSERMFLFLMFMLLSLVQIRLTLNNVETYWLTPRFCST